MKTHHHTIQMSYRLFLNSQYSEEFGFEIFPQISDICENKWVELGLIMGMTERYQFRYLTLDNFNRSPEVFERRLGISKRMKT